MTIDQWSSYGGGRYVEQSCVTWTGVLFLYSCLQIASEVLWQQSVLFLFIPLLFFSVVSLPISLGNLA